MLNLGEAKQGKISITQKFCETVGEAENFRVLKGVIWPETPLATGVQDEKKHSWRVLILEILEAKTGCLEAKTGCFLVQNEENEFLHELFGRGAGVVQPLTFGIHLT